MGRAVDVKYQGRIMALILPLEEEILTLWLGALPEIEYSEIEYSQKSNKGISLLTCLFNSAEVIIY